MLEVRCTALTIRPVLDASGHTAKFSDYMITDTVNSQLYRADQYIEKFLQEKYNKSKNETERNELKDVIPAVGDYSREQLIECMKKYEIISPDGNPLSTPEAFNLMFGTRIGPGARSVESFLRPETAQGIFVNFPRLFNTNRGSLPFAAAQIGVAYRNEISPRNGLVRCREFQMAEIEHFCDPEKLNDFPKFDNITNVIVSLLPASYQKDNLPSISISIGEAMEKNILPHKTMAYYIGRVNLFLIDLGLIPEKIRFRQHRANEKAHYSRDCWDAEVFTETTGWLECVGIADRQSFDLTQHAMFTAKKGEKYNPQMIVTTKLDEPIKGHRFALLGEKSILGKFFKKEASDIIQAFTEIPEEEMKKIQLKVQEAEQLIGGSRPTLKELSNKISKLNPEELQRFNELTTFEILGKKITYDMYSITDEDYEITTRSFIPCVIEPSMGIGRIMTVLLDHSFYLRPENRRVLRLPSHVSPYKCVILPIGAKLIPQELIYNIRQKLRKYNIAHQFDSSGASIGKRYSRSDEIGTPFAITLDQLSVQDNSITLRERDSMEQIRGNIDDIINVLLNLINNMEKWEDIKLKFSPVKPPTD